jgi:molybdopterin molybdotransferase
MAIRASTMMIGVDEALARVLAVAEQIGPLPVEEVPLREATGRILREDVLASRDMPPFTRSAMDGYALRAGDTTAAPVLLDVIEEIPAGKNPVRTVGPGQASRIMTGAPLPEGADAVQMVENTERLEGDRVRVMKSVPPGEHVRRAGEDLKAGSILIRSGAGLVPALIGLLASEGRARVRVARRARVAIIPTGDELVRVDEEPSAGQIRESNGHVLEALVTQAGGQPELFGAARDQVEDLRYRISHALSRHDVLLLSGGVSMGDYDLVGGVLKDLGCVQLFDRVAIQPGKPLYFGRWSRPAGGDVMVFGLPGNPVSTIVDFIVFARPALRRLSGASSWLDPQLTARLAEPLTRRAQKPPRRAYLPATLRGQEDALSVTLIPSMGSADMVALGRANALAIIAEDVERLEAGVRVRVLPLGVMTPAGC